MAPCEDILQEIPRVELPLIRDYYEKHLPYATHVYSFFNTAMKWMKAKPNKEFFTFYAPNGDWRSDGTFVAFLHFSCYDLFPFTMDPTCARLQEALRLTKRFDYENNMVLFYALHKDHRDAVIRTMEQIKVPVHFETETYIYWMPKEEAANLTVNCPEGYYIKTLESEHAPIVNELWPHKYENSVNYLATFIEMNGGHGVFTKDGDKLVSWILKNQMGTLGILQTIEEYKRKGLGSEVTKSLSKEIGQEGHNPIGTVLTNNEASQVMFSKLNFTILDNCPEGYYIKTLKPEHAPLIHNLYPHKSELSMEYVRTYIEMNGGHGIFTKDGHELVSWILKNPMGTMGFLQTVDEHKRRGLGSEVTKSLSKEIGLEGHNPIGTVVTSNEASKTMFSKLNYSVLDRCMYIGAGKSTR